MGPDYLIVRWEKVKVNESHTLARERGIGAGTRVEKMDSTGKKDGFLVGEGG